MESFPDHSDPPFPAVGQAQNSASSCPILKDILCQEPQTPLLIALHLISGAYLVDFKELGISTWPLNGHFDNVRWWWHGSWWILLLQVTYTESSCLGRKNQEGESHNACLHFTLVIYFGESKDSV